jgi:hypothetical protein
MNFCKYKLPVAARAEAGEPLLAGPVAAGPRPARWGVATDVGGARLDDLKYEKLEIHIINYDKY